MILYHGTQVVIDRFDPALIGRGAEPNSALGVWATLDPHQAHDYAGGKHLLVLSVKAPKLASVSDYQAAIWGGPDYGPSERVIARQMFEAARLSLMAQGYDGVWCECPGTDLNAAVCLFSAQSVKIQQVIRYAEDRDLDDLEDPQDDSIVDINKRLEDELSLACQKAAAPA
jgi:hypothetical protein